MAQLMHGLVAMILRCNRVGVPLPAQGEREEEEGSGEVQTARSETKIILHILTSISSVSRCTGTCSHVGMFPG